MTHAHGQSGYQVRFDWGASGAAVIADGAHLVVWVDQLAPAGSGPEPMPVVGGTPGGVEFMPATLDNASLALRFRVRAVELSI